MKLIRFGVIGLGNIGVLHVAGLARKDNKYSCLGAVCDVVADKAANLGRQNGVPHFTDAQAMYDSGAIDAVIVAMPHYFHPVLTIRAARAGLHVMCEKPLAVTIGAARAMVAECKKHKVAMGAMLLYRCLNLYKKMKQMVEAGMVGEVYRLSMTCSFWYRTQSYYNSADWRGTWDGEGGGVLLNQAPHSLDLFQWIGGMPRRVIATVGTRWHKIEVENHANVICEYGSGKSGYIYASSADSPGSDQFAVYGDKGVLIGENGKLRFGKIAQPLRKHIVSCKDGFTAPASTWQDVPLQAETPDRHVLVNEAFARHILKGTPMIASGAEGLNQLEISNAAYLSGHEGRPVDLPVDAKQMENLLSRLERKHSSGRGGGMRAQAAKEFRALMART